MAQVDTANNPNDPNNPNNLPGNQGAPQGANQPATTGGGGPVTATGAANVTGQVVGTATPSQPFQNISSYLAANAPQSVDLANKVASSVTEPINKAQGDITNASQTFSNSVNAGFTPENKDLVNRVTSNPTEVAANPDDVAAFQKQLNDTYTGPTDITGTPNYSNIESEIANAQSLGQNALTPTGIQTLLQGVEGPTTAGVNNLDTLLLAQNPENFQTVKNAGLAANTTNNALQNFLTQQAAQDNASAQAATKATQSTVADANAALNTAATNVASPVSAAFNSALTGTENYNAALSEILNAVGTGNLGNLTPTQQSEIGFNPQLLTALSEYPQVFPTVTQANMPNIPLYYSGPKAATLPTNAAQVETPAQAAAVAALEVLNGGNTLPALTGLSATAPATPFKVPTDFGAYNNVGLADYLYNALEPTYLQYQQIPGGTPTSGNNYGTINSLMQLLSTLTNQSIPQPTPTQPSGPPFVGPPGGDVHRGGI